MIRTVLVKPATPATARQPCRAPVQLPDRDMSQAEVTSAWGQDRVALVECETRRAAAVEASK